ncbi:MAG: hypothetical protein H6685_08695 [Deltaproteobacteria bacterium]|nr:hypothetical protein [Deltaproteobacteria bacterium]
MRKYCVICAALSLVLALGCAGGDGSSDSKVSSGDASKAGDSGEIPEGYECYEYHPVQNAGLTSQYPMLLAKTHESGAVVGAYGYIGTWLSSVGGYDDGETTYLFADTYTAIEFETHLIEDASGEVETNSYDADGQLVPHFGQEFTRVKVAPEDCAGMEIDPEYTCVGVFCEDSNLQWLVSLLDRLFGREPEGEIMGVCLEGDFSVGHRMDFTVDQLGRIEGLERMYIDKEQPIGGYFFGDEYVVFTDYADGRDRHELGVYVIDADTLTGKRFRATDRGRLDRENGLDVTFTPCE